MAKRLKADEALSSKINTLPEDFMKYLEGSEERFLKEMQENKFKLVKASPTLKHNGTIVNSYIFGNITQDMIQGIQDVLRTQDIPEIAIVVYGVSKLSVIYSKSSKKLNITYHNVDRLKITKDNYYTIYSPGKSCMLEFYKPSEEYADLIGRW